MKIALVTGAGEGIGKKTCEILAAKKFKIIALDSMSTALLQKSLKALKTDLIEVKGGVNFTNQDSVQTALNTITFDKTWTVLANCVGVNLGGGLLDSNLEDWNAMMNANLTTPYILSQAFAKNCKQYSIKGSIINISSMVGVIGAKKPGYAASRAGILGLTKAIAMQSGPDIRCNAIYTGAVNDAMHADWDEEKKKKVAAATPIGRIAEPAEIANIVAFLADDQQSGFLTGSIINATGGQYLGQ